MSDPNHLLTNAYISAQILIFCTIHALRKVQKFSLWTLHRLNKYWWRRLMAQACELVYASWLTSSSATAVEVCVWCTCDKLSPLLCSLPVCNSPSKKKKKKVAENEEEVAIKKLSSLPVSAKQLWAIWGNATHVEISAPHEKRTAFGTQLSRRREELSEITEKQVMRRKS